MSDARHLFGALAAAVCFFLVIGGTGYWAGRSTRIATVEVRYDSLKAAYADCRGDLATAKTGATVAVQFLQDYDKQISRLEDEKRLLTHRYTDSLAVLRQYSSTDAERAIAAYYYRSGNRQRR